MPLSLLWKRMRLSSALKEALPMAVVAMNWSIVYCFGVRGLSAAAEAKAKRRAGTSASMRFTAGTIEGKGE
jgi:hypothetical protein